MGKNNTLKQCKRVSLGLKQNKIGIVKINLRTQTTYQADLLTKQMNIYISYKKQSNKLTLLLMLKRCPPQLLNCKHAIYHHLFQELPASIRKMKRKKLTNSNTISGDQQSTPIPTQKQSPILILTKFKRSVTNQCTSINPHRSNKQKGIKRKQNSEIQESNTKTQIYNITSVCDQKEITI